jgi:hypothetical protein
MRIVLLALLGACGGGGDSPEHWNTRPLETFEGTNEGVTFTLQMPKGMKQTQVGSTYRVYWSYFAKRGGEDYSFAPSFTVSKTRRQTLADSVKDDAGAKLPEGVMFQEESATGWVYAVKNDAYKDKEDYLIKGQTFLGDADALSCNARLYPMTKGGDAKGDIPKVMKMCQSLKAK